MASLALAALVVTGALQWRPLTTAWRLRTLKGDPAVLTNYIKSPEGSVRRDALMAYVRTEEGGEAFIDWMFLHPWFRELVAEKAPSLEIVHKVLLFSSSSGHLFVNLLQVVRSEAKAGIHQWSIGNMDPVHHFSRDTAWGLLLELVGQSVILKGTPTWRVTVLAEGEIVVLRITPAAVPEEAL